MFVEYLIYIVVGLASITVVGSVNDNVLLNSFLKRAVAGITVNLGILGTLGNYTNVVTFYSACAQGLVGVAGYVFVVSNFMLALVWISNLVKYRSVVV